MSSKIQTPYPSFADTDGRPLDAGYIYIGEAGKNPEVYPIPVFWDEALTIPAAQPLRTRNGYFSKNGTAGKIFIKSASCSIKVKNKKLTPVYTDLYSDLSFNQKDIIKVVSSIYELLTLEKWEGRVVHVESYHAADYTSPVVPVTEGGGDFRYVASLSTINDGGVCINGWLRLKTTYNYLTPEMFGSKGVGASFDDYQSIQNMFNAGAVGCTFEFDGAKTYYNAFGNFTASSPWLAESNRPQWVRNSRCTFKFNGAKLTRRRPDWNTNNAVDDGNTGSFYTDDRTGLLKISGNGPWYMSKANFDGNVPLGYLYNYNTGNTDIGDGSYGAGTCMDWGLRMESVTDFFGENCTFQKSCFPVSVVNCSNIHFDGLSLKYAAQAKYRTNAEDPGAYGGGIKLESSNHIYLRRVIGYKNANDTVELERYNNHVFVQGSSDKDINQSLMVYSSANVYLDWTGENILAGTGVSIFASGTDTDSSNITGKIVIKNCYGTGVNIVHFDDYNKDWAGVDLDITTYSCNYGGLVITNNHSTCMPKGIKINHIDYNGGDWLNASRKFTNKMTGKISGSSHKINGYNFPTNFTGVVLHGSNTKDTCLDLSLNLTEVPLVWVCPNTAIASLISTTTSWAHFNMSAQRDCYTGSLTLGLSYVFGGSDINSSSLNIKGATINAASLASVATSNGQIYVDLASGSSVGSGTAYNLKYLKTP